MESVAGFLDALAAPRPDPGGGAASAVMLASGVALAQMVTGYSPDAVAADPALPGRLARLREAAAAMVDADARASAGFASALGLPPTDPGRAKAVARACLDAAGSALAIADLARELLTDLALLDRLGERRVHADVRVAAAATGATVRASIANVEACLGLARTTGAVAADLRDVERRLDSLIGPLTLADSLA